jgi:hypothetical protein
LKGQLAMHSKMTLRLTLNVCGFLGLSAWGWSDGANEKFDASRSEDLVVWVKKYHSPTGATFSDHILTIASQNGGDLVFEASETVHRLLESGFKY